MFENTIEDILEKDPITKDIFKGVYARDELPNPIKSYPNCFIFNNKPRSNAGEHWLAVFFNSDKTCYFFDSYGMNPSFYGLTNYLKSNCKKINYNQKRLQGDSDLCGFYCIAFLYFKSRNKLKEFFDIFSNNLLKNDNFIFSNIILNKNFKK